MYGQQNIKDRGYFSASIKLGKEKIHTKVNYNKWQLCSVREDNLKWDKHESGGEEVDENSIQL
jgi:hypothetical protein